MIWFIVTVVVVYLYYYLFVIRKYDEKGNRIIKEKKGKGTAKEKAKSKKKKEVDVVKYPSEVELFIYGYKIDLKKVNFRAMTKAIALVCSIDIALVVTILSYIPLGMVWKLLIGAVIVFVVILISFSLLGKYFKKKGLTKHV